MIYHTIFWFDWFFCPIGGITYKHKNCDLIPFRSVTSEWLRILGSYLVGWCMRGQRCVTPKNRSDPILHFALCISDNSLNGFTSTPGKEWVKYECEIVDTTELVSSKNSTVLPPKTTDVSYAFPTNAWWGFIRPPHDCPLSQFVVRLNLYQNFSHPFVS
jgi:hypothetical protein